jgi:regulator of CtrA degradation
MNKGDPTSRIHRRLIDALYTESMVLADEARAYFDEMGRNERDTLDAMTRVVFSCESLKVTTRLMHVIALGKAPETDSAAFDVMPPAAQGLIAASQDLYRRVARIDTAQDEEAPVPVSPARRMLDRLAHAF